MILIIDTSASMIGDKLELAKTAAKSVINTLSNNDFLGVINFGSTARTVYTNKITRATIDHRYRMEEEINNLEVTGFTNYQAAFQLGFDMINAAETDEFGAPCTNGENVFLFLTDGEPTLGHTNSADLITMIDGYNKQITLFTYALGSGINTAILKDLACQYGGIMFAITDTSTDSATLTTTMRSYYTYISEGVSITSPVWTEPYEDAFGFGRLVTVSMPVYFEEGGVRKILGVVGIDVQYYQIEFGMSEQEVISRLISNAPCQASNLTDCQIEALRGISTCGGANCSTAGTIAACNTAAEIFQTSDLLEYDTSDYKCCGITIGGLVAAVVVPTVVVSIVLGIVIYCKKKGENEEKARNL